MKDLSKAERLEQRITELEQLIYKKDYELDNEQWKRTKRTFFVICGVIYFVELCIVLTGGISNINIDDFCGLLFAPLVAVGFIMFISYGILYYSINGTIKKVATLAKLEGELNAIKSEKYNNFEDEKIKELERHIDHLENYYAHKCDNCTILKLLKEVEEDEED